MHAYFNGGGGNDMKQERLAEADRIVTALAAGKREAIREIVVDATKRGHLTESARRFIDANTGSSVVADVLEEALAEPKAGDAPPPSLAAG